MTGPESQIELFHGYTYSGHPVACAAGIATLDIYIVSILSDAIKRVA
jgi:beta-alanine--pyruvate transaminase